MSAFNDFLDDFMDNKLLSLHTSFLGKLEKVNLPKMRADVRPLIQLRDKAQTINYPTIQNVPLGFVNSGGFYIRPHYTVGDFVFISCSEVSLSKMLDERNADEIDNRHEFGNAFIVTSMATSKFVTPTNFVGGTGLQIGHKNGAHMIFEANSFTMVFGVTKIIFDAGGVRAEIAGFTVDLFTHQHPGSAGPPIPT